MADTKEVTRQPVQRSRWSKLKAKALSGVGKRNQRELIEQYYVSLGATFERICERSREHDRHIDLIARIADLFRDEYTWSNAYKIEQLIIPLYSTVELDIELDRQMIDAEQAFYTTVYTYYNEAKKTLDVEGAGSPPEDQRHERKVLFSRLVKDLQWRSQIKDSGRDYARHIRIRSGLIFMFSVLIFLAVLYFDIDLLILAMASGFIGASFSVLLNLKKRLAESNYEEKKVTYRWSYIFTRASIGLGAALIIFFFIKAELLDGDMFPDIAVAEQVSEQPTATPPAAGDDAEDPKKARALLVIWCFLAGFSESLVPTLLKQTEEKATGEKKDDEKKDTKS